METRGNRSRSNRAIDYEGNSTVAATYGNRNDDDDDTSDGPPAYDPSMFANSSSSGDGDDDGDGNEDGYEVRPDDDDEEEDDKEENEDELPRTRARSKSVLDAYEPKENDKGIMLIHPSVINEMANGEHILPKHTEKIVEKKGPLQSREVEILQKGVEEAVAVRKPEVIREEREEKLAAEEEKKKRLSSTLVSSRKNNQHLTDPTRAKILLLGDSGVGKSSLICRWTQDTFSTDLIGTVGVNFKSRKVQLDSIVGGLDSLSNNNNNNNSTTTNTTPSSTNSDNSNSNNNSNNSSNNNDECVTVQVWDTAGQEQFHQITTSYYKGAQGIMLVFDVADVKSQENVGYWIRKIKEHANEAVKVVIIGNKVDLRNKQQQQQQQQQQESNSDDNNNNNNNNNSNNITCVSSAFGEKLSQTFNVPYFETSAKESIGVEVAFATLVKKIFIVEETTTTTTSSSTTTATTASTATNGRAASKDTTTRASSTASTQQQQPQQQQQEGGRSRRASFFKAMDKQTSFMMKKTDTCLLS